MMFKPVFSSSALIKMPVWVSETRGNVPKDAFKAGRDKEAIVYVGRAEHKNDKLPAKVISGHSHAYVSYGGKELAKDNYEVLRGYAYYWEPFIAHMPMPKRAVSAGQAASGEDLFVVRVVHKGSDVIGKVREA